MVTRTSDIPVGRNGIVMQGTAVLVIAVAYLMVNTLPAVTGVLARHLAIQPHALGAFGTAEIAGNAVGAFLATLVMRQVSPRATVTAGLLLLFAANLGSAAAAWTFALVALRAVGGIGTGLAVSACNYVFSLQNRERIPFIVRAENEDIGGSKNFGNIRSHTEESDAAGQAATWRALQQADESFPAIIGLTLLLPSYPRVLPNAV